MSEKGKLPDTTISAALSVLQRHQAKDEAKVASIQSQATAVAKPKAKSKSQLKKKPAAAVKSQQDYKWEDIEDLKKDFDLTHEEATAVLNTICGEQPSAPSKPAPKAKSKAQAKGKTRPTPKDEPMQPADASQATQPNPSTPKRQPEEAATQIDQPTATSKRQKVQAGETHTQTITVDMVLLHCQATLDKSFDNTPLNDAQPREDYGRKDSQHSLGHPSSMLRWHINASKGSILGHAQLCSWARRRLLTK